MASVLDALLAQAAGTTTVDGAAVDSKPTTAETAQYALVSAKDGWAGVIRGEADALPVEDVGVQAILTKLEKASQSFQVGDDGTGVLVALARITGQKEALIRQAILPQTLAFFTEMDEGWMNHFARKEYRGFYLNPTVTKTLAEVNAGAVFVALAEKRAPRPDAQQRRPGMFQRAGTLAA